MPILANVRALYSCCEGRPATLERAYQIGTIEVPIDGEMRTDQALARFLGSAAGRASPDRHSGLSSDPSQHRTGMGTGPGLEAARRSAVGSLQGDLGPLDGSGPGLAAQRVVWLVSRGSDPGR